MKRHRVGVNDEVTASSAVDVKDTAMLNTEARERFATGTNSTKRHTVKHGAFGKLGLRGQGK